MSNGSPNVKWYHTWLSLLKKWAWDFPFFSFLNSKWNHQLLRCYLKYVSGWKGKWQLYYLRQACFDGHSMINISLLINIFLISVTFLWTTFPWAEDLSETTSQRSTSEVEGLHILNSPFPNPTVWDYTRYVAVVVSNCFLFK